MESRDSLVKDIEARLARDGIGAEALEAILDRILADFDCAVGTIHFYSRASGRLELRAERGVPDSILPQVRSIPIGKGMAGIAAARLEPVQVCNLQADTSGVARPSARETRMEGSIALPIIVDGELRGTLGVAKPVIHEFTSLEIARLERVAAAIGRSFVPVHGG